MNIFRLKNFTFAIVLGFTGLQARAFPINRILKDPPPEYVREYWKRMDSWYQNLFVSYQSSLSPNELKLLATVRSQTENWGVPVSDKWTFRSFWYAHHVEGKQVFHRHIFYSVNPKKLQQASLLRQVLSEHGVAASLPLVNLWGIAENFDENTFEVQFMLKRDEVDKFSQALGNRKAEFVRFFNTQVSSTSSEPLLVHLVYRKRVLQDVGLTIPMSNAEDPSMVKYAPMLKVIAWAKRTYLSGKSEELLQLADMNMYMLSDIGKYILIKHRQEFGQLPLFIVWNSHDDYTLYYP